MHSRVKAALLAVSVVACDTGEPRGAGMPVDTPTPAAPAAEPPRDTAPAAPQADAELRVALEKLVRGERPPSNAGQRTWFSEETANVLRSVQVDSVGHAVIDFYDLRPLIPNASSSAGSKILLDDLNAVVFSFPEIRSVEYRMEGSCDLFGEWLQYGCLVVGRER